MFKYDVRFLITGWCHWPDAAFEEMKHPPGWGIARRVAVHWSKSCASSLRTVHRLEHDPATTDAWMYTIDHSMKPKKTNNNNKVDIEKSKLIALRMPRSGQMVEHALGYATSGLRQHRAQKGAGHFRARWTTCGLMHYFAQFVNSPTPFRSWRNRREIVLWTGVEHDDSVSHSFCWDSSYDKLAKMFPETK